MIFGRTGLRTYSHSLRIHRYRLSVRVKQEAGALAAFTCPYCNALGTASQMGPRRPGTRSSCFNVAPESHVSLSNESDICTGGLQLLLNVKMACISETGRWTHRQAPDRDRLSDPGTGGNVRTSGNNVRTSGFIRHGAPMSLGHLPAMQ